MRPKYDAGELSGGNGVMRALALPMNPKATSRMKRIAEGTVGRIVRPLRSIKVLDWLASRAFQVWYEMPVPPTHYYSPLPDIPQVKKNLHRWYREDNLVGMQMDLDGQRALLESLALFSAECDKLPRFEQVSATGYGLGYGEVEAHFLHCLIRHFKPRRFIEIGSGVSTYFALHALEVNREIEGIDSAMICVEPLPDAQTAWASRSEESNCLRTTGSGCR